MNIVTEAFTYKLLTATANICSGDGVLGGVWCSSGTATVTIYDDSGTGTTTKMVDTFTPTAATYSPLPFGFANGCYVVISGTGSITVAYKKG